MNRLKNNKWLLLLMLISQIMLTGMVFQWLRSQWMEESQSLTRDISAQFRESVNEILDSMLLEHLVVPVMKDSSIKVNNVFRINTGNDSCVSTDNKFSAVVNGKGEHERTIVTISIPDSGHSFKNETIKFRGSDSIEANIMLRSVKLFIGKNTEGEGEWNQMSNLVSAVPDTVLLKRLFEDKINKEGRTLTIVWKSDSIYTTGQNNKSKIYFESGLFQEPYGAEIGELNAALLKRITPQLLFAIVLLIFTGAAFFFTYRSLVKMETLNDIRNDFISNISHELKTPVSTVTIALEALRNYDQLKDPDKAAEYLDIACTEMGRLDQLVTQVLNSSLLDNKNQYVVLQKTDLVSLTQEVINSMQVRLVQQHAKISLEVPDEVIILELDRLHIQGVIINIIDNSLKYASAEPLIKLTIKKEGSNYLLSIRDNGPGIPEEYLPKVFDKFFRVPTEDKHNVKGYGLGLSFAFLVMNQHNGSISVRNNKDEGCMFTLSFPLKDR